MGFNQGSDLKMPSFAGNLNSDVYFTISESVEYLQSKTPPPHPLQKKYPQTLLFCYNLTAE